MNPLKINRWPLGYRVIYVYKQNEASGDGFINSTKACHFVYFRRSRNVYSVCR